MRKQKLKNTMQEIFGYHDVELQNSYFDQAGKRISNVLSYSIDNINKTNRTTMNTNNTFKFLNGWKKSFTYICLALLILSSVGLVTSSKARAYAEQFIVKVTQNGNFKEFVFDDNNPETINDVVAIAGQNATEEDARKAKDYAEESGRLIRENTEALSKIDFTNASKVEQLIQSGVITFSLKAVNAEEKKKELSTYLKTVYVEKYYANYDFTIKEGELHTKHNPVYAEINTNVNKIVNAINL